MSGNGILNSLCEFSRKISFSVDINLEKVILQKILDSIFLKTLFTQHIQSCLQFHLSIFLQFVHKVTF